ncbi:hypothetical protein [Leptospira santarosai]|uniref:Tetratricopeptide repeat protein n=1 Tax=Leptospira santarosai serovar Arenal str. MAVJ 401 TaxID=1049976 RepID=M6JVE5_9LEPT|nr:hypothetical protein [Leptospira santarosai]EMN19452.1 hypothetical protein LEP1GSC063_2297 [Leptospira santarosai serovar Arenal str. MAVJ 401]
MKTRKSFVSTWDELDYLYHKILKYFYGLTPNYTKAKLFANRLEKLLDTMELESMSIRVEECKSITCEIRGDLFGAIRHRRREIKLLKNLLLLPEYSKLVPELVGDNSDLADRLILLAILYQNVGFSEKAIHCLEEARELAKKTFFSFSDKKYKNLFYLLGSYRVK